MYVMCVCVFVLLGMYIAALQAIFQKKRRPNECSEDTWSMTQLSHENKTANSSVSYVYKTNKVGAADNRHYHCSEYEFAWLYNCYIS